MNERIRELAEQAGYKPLPGVDFANSLEEVFIKNFAQLIVKECAYIMDKDADHPFVSRGSILKHHFGVE